MSAYNGMHKEIDVSLLDTALVSSSEYPGSNIDRGYVLGSYICRTFACSFPSCRGYSNKSKHTVFNCWNFLVEQDSAQSLEL